MDRGKNRLNSEQVTSYIAPPEQLTQNSPEDPVFMISQPTPPEKIFMYASAITQ